MRAQHGNRSGAIAVRVCRAVAAAGFLAVAATVWLAQGGYRADEASAAGWLSHVLLGVATFTYRPGAVFYLQVGRPQIFGLSVTAECTSAILVAIVFAVTALATALTRVQVRRLAAAALAAAATFAALNLARLVLIAAATRTWGRGGGFHWSHVWLGTFVTVFGAALTFAVYLYVLGVRRDGARPAVSRRP